MKVTTEHLADRQAVMTVEVEEERTEQALRQTARRLSHRMRIPGFRPGKAPYSVVLRTVGEDNLRAEAFETLGQRLYEEALEEAGIEAYAQGSLDDLQWDPLTFTVTVPLPPRVELGEYSELRVSPEPILILDEEVDEGLEALRERHAEWAPVDRPAGYGDMLVLDIKGAVAGEEIMDQQNWARVLREDSGGALPGFDAALVGLTSGDSHSFDIVYPDDSTQWAGETAHFEAKLHGVKAKQLPALDDGFARTLGEHDTLEGIREALREDMRARREAEADYEGKVLDALADQAGIEFPPLMLENELDDLMEEHDRLLRQQGLPLDDFLRVSGKSKDDYREENRGRADRRLRRSLVLSEFAKLEEISIDDEDVDDETERRVSLQSGENAARLRTLLDSTGGRLAVRNDLLTRRALLRLISIARGDAEDSDDDTQMQGSDAERESADKDTDD